MKKYSFKLYSDSSLDLKTLKSSDLQVDSKVLLLEPLKVYQGRTGMYNCLLKYNNIAEIKRLLRETDCYGINMLQVDCEGMAEKKLEKIFRAIEFYEQQVIRIVESHPDLSNVRKPIFFIDKYMKDLIVREQIKEIAEYLVNSGDDFMFGELKRAKKQMLLERVSAERDNFTVENFVDVISNYTTLEELENDVVKTKVLNRFIIK